MNPELKLLPSVKKAQPKPKPKKIWKREEMADLMTYLAAQGVIVKLNSFRLKSEGHWFVCEIALPWRKGEIHIHGSSQFDKPRHKHPYDAFASAYAKFFQKYREVHPKPKEDEPIAVKLELVL